MYDLSATPGGLSNEIEFGMANVFCASAADDLCAVGFYYIPDPGSDNPSDQAATYRIEIHLDPVSGPLNPVGPALAFYASFPWAGYYTVDFPQRVRLDAGQKFSVVFLSPETENELPCAGGDRAPSENGGSSWLRFSSDSDWGPYDLKRHLQIRAYTTPAAEISQAGIARMPDGRLAVTLTSHQPSSLTLRAVVKPILAERAVRPVDVPTEYYVNQNGAKVIARDGLMQLSPGETVTAFFPTGGEELRGPLACAVYHVEPSGPRMLPTGGWTHIGLNLKALQVVSITVEDPFIALIFDQDIKRGPSLWKVRLTSASEVNFVVPWIDGKTLTLVGVRSFDSKYSVGKLWALRIPKDAVTGASGNALENDYAWSFTPPKAPSNFEIS
jgi:hypothetical protein